MVTLSSRAGSVYGSRPTSPHTRSMSGMGVGDNLGTLKSNKSQVGTYMLPKIRIRIVKFKLRIRIKLAQKGQCPERIDLRDFFCSFFWFRG